MINRLRLVALAMVTCCSFQSAHAQQFGRIVTLGDSLSDAGRVPRETDVDISPLINPVFVEGRSSNGELWVEELPTKIGAISEPEDNYAVSGAVSGNGSVIFFAPPLADGVFPAGFTQQVSQIVQERRLASNDVIAIWIGTNDFSQTVLPDGPSGTPQGYFGLSGSEVIAQLNTNLLNGITRLSDAGGREFVVFNLNDQQAVLTSDRAAFNAQLEETLRPLSERGLNVRLFDVAGLLDQMRLNPQRFGFAENAGVRSCAEATACTDRDVADNYITLDGVHFSRRANSFISAYLGNQLVAPNAYVPMTQLGLTASLDFGRSLLARADTTRLENGDANRKGGLFAIGSRRNARKGRQAPQPGLLDPRYDIRGDSVGIGVETPIAKLANFGLAFSYDASETGLSAGDGGAYIEADTYLVSAFASLGTGEKYVDLAIIHGWSDLSASRTGVFEPISSESSGINTRAIARAGWLAQLGSVQVGPIARAEYSISTVDPFFERGDPLLTQNVSRQREEHWSGAVGLQVVKTWDLQAGTVKATMNAMAERDLSTRLRTIETAQTYAPSLMIRSMTGREQHDTYGTAQATLAAGLREGLEIFISGDAIFARDEGRTETIRLGANWRF